MLPTHSHSDKTAFQLTQREDLREKYDQLRIDQIKLMGENGKLRDVLHKVAGLLYEEELADALELIEESKLVSEVTDDDDEWDF